MSNQIISFETVRDNGSGMSKEPRNDGRDEASRERCYWLLLKKGALL